MGSKEHMLVLFMIFSAVFSPVWVRTQDPHDYFAQEEADYEDYYDDTSAFNNYTNNVTLPGDEKNNLNEVLIKFNPEFTDKIQSLQNWMYEIAHILKDISGKMGCEDAGLCNPPFKKVLSGECVYLNVDNRKTWQEAREICQSMGADLAEPVGIRQNLNYIMSLHGNTMIRIGRDRLWVGASDQDGEGAWKWVSGNPVAEDISWSKDHPWDITGREDCMAMIYKQHPTVTATNCRTKNYFVCQKKYLIS